jgi:hypothetical protein
MVSVTVPVGGIDMDLGIACPLSAADDKTRAEEIRTGVTVILARVDHLYRSGFPVAQAPGIKEQVFPQPVEELFFHDRYVLKCSLSKIITSEQKNKRKQHPAFHIFNVDFEMKRPLVALIGKQEESNRRRQQRDPVK